MARFTLRLPDSLYRQWRLRAAAEGVSVNQLIVYLLTGEMALDQAMVKAIQKGEVSDVVSRDEVMNALQCGELARPEWHNHIDMDEAVLGGKPVIKGTRVPVAAILKQLSNGAAPAEIVDEYEGLTEEDIRMCLLFAAEAMETVFSSGYQTGGAYEVTALSEEDAHGQAERFYELLSRLRTGTSEEIQQALDSREA